MNKNLSVPEAAQQLKKSPAWVRAAIKHKKIRAERVGHVFVIAAGEIKRIKEHPIQVTRKEMFL